MKVLSATFVVEVGGQVWHVLFSTDVVKLWWTSQFDASPLYKVANERKTWKPCMNHAMDLVRWHRKQSARCNQAAQRVAATKPVLSIVTDL